MEPFKSIKPLFIQRTHYAHILATINLLSNKNDHCGDLICFVSQMNKWESEQPPRAWCNNIIWQELNRPGGSQWIIQDK